MPAPSPTSAFRCRCEPAPCPHGRDRRPAPPRLRIGPLTVDPPVVLAPMAGVTNAPFRQLCRRYGGGLYVSEMITARAFVEGNAKTARMVTFGPDEVPRSLQLYGTDPADPRGGRAPTGRRGRGGAHRPQLRLPCPEGHAAGRWRRAARQAGAAALDRAGLRGCGAALGHPRHHEVPHGGARRRADVPRSGPHRRGRGGRRSRAPRPYGGAALLGPGRVAGHRRAEGGRDVHPGAGQRRHLGGIRCSGHGGRDRMRRRGGRPGVPRPPLAVRRPRGGLHRQGARPGRRGWARWRW